MRADEVQKGLAAFGKLGSFSGWPRKNEAYRGYAEGVLFSANERRVRPAHKLALIYSTYRANHVPSLKRSVPHGFGQSPLFGRLP